ncbi:hypothetical protein TIFTF001_020700 [Ficus carica]|uniref:Aminotransferase-like plant mobile domain-containing protein n=1 Tax=Ficus carica TaxID=3494 RepID=A0AA88DJN2_FICCA|nr:hypothetical protein TIFTF001_020700 [Ficus carica]
MAETPDTIFEEREEEILISATSSGWRFPLKEWGNWAGSLLPKCQSTWKKAGIYEAITVSVYKIPRDKKLVFGLAEKWSSITNTFVFPWGEATVTLEYVMVLGGFSVLGESVLAQIDDQESVDIHLELIEKLKEAATLRNLTRTATGSWLRYFMGSESELKHEAFLSYWLSQHVFPTANYFVGQHVFPIAIRLARGIRIALAPAILAGVYSELRLLNEELVASAVLGKDEFRDVTLVAHLQVVQLWAWKRFPTLPKRLPLIDGSPKLRPARWKDLKIVPNGNIRMALDSAGESFRWRPYASSVDYWLLRKFGLDKEWSVLVDQDLDEELETLARCLRVSELVGINCIEQYLPHRVSNQFGMDQDIPHPVARCNGTRSVAWSNYSRPISDAKLYIPSRHFMAGVTVQYAKWWKNSALNRVLV